MRPLICPQCGGRIDEYLPGADFTVCEYCSTKFLIEPNKAPRPKYEPVAVKIQSPDIVPTFVKVLGVVLVVVALIGIVAVASLVSRKEDQARALSGTGPRTPAIRTPRTPTPIATPTPDEALMRFGQAGDEPGEFGEASSIAVDSAGRIYVADLKLRVHQFDGEGTAIKMLQVPAKGANYARAKEIDKIAIAPNGSLYVAVGGVILIYGDDWTAKPRVIHNAPNYIQDFAFKSDGSMLAVADNDRIETLLVYSRDGRLTRRLEGFHTDGLNASISPMSTAIESVRVAVDSAGKMASIYALGSLGSYSISYSDEALYVARYAPDLKFNRPHAAARNISTLAFDHSGRLHVLARNSITVYDGDGNVLGFRNVDNADSFALDAEGNIYTAGKAQAAKYPPVKLN